MMRKNDNDERIKLLEDRVDYLCKNMETHKELERFYVDLISDRAEFYAKKAVSEILQNPIEMTMADIEAAFGHKIKIVEG